MFAQVVPQLPPKLPSPGSPSSPCSGFPHKSGATGPKKSSRGICSCRLGFLLRFFSSEEWESPHRPLSSHGCHEFLRTWEPSGSSHIVNSMTSILQTLLVPSPPPQCLAVSGVPAHSRSVRRALCVAASPLIPSNSYHPIQNTHCQTQESFFTPMMHDVIISNDHNILC